MRRREFITLIATAVAAWPRSTRAQTTNKIPKIGVLWHAGTEAEEALYLTPFREGLSALGYADGRNITIINTFAAEQYERFNSNALELAKIPVDVLVAVTRPAAFAAQRATSTIPIVFILVPDPVRSKLVESLSRPGGNVTGLTQIGFELNGKRLEILKHATGLSRLALLVNASDPAMARLNIEEFQTSARALQINLDVFEVRKPEDLNDAFHSIGQKGLGGLITGIDPMLYNERKRIAELAITRRIAAMGHVGEMTKDGLLMSYAANFPSMFRRAAAYIDRILKGERPNNIPVEQPTKFEFIINLNTAKALGLTISPTLLTRADEVIE